MMAAGNCGLAAADAGRPANADWTVPQRWADYTAGEQEEWGATPAEWPAPDGVHWHMLTSMGSDWGQVDLGMSDGEIIEHINTINERGGTDAPCDAQRAHGGGKHGRGYNPHQSCGK